MLKALPIYKHNTGDPVYYLTTITFADGASYVLKGKAKTTASIVNSPRTMKKIHEHLGLLTIKDINDFNSDTYKELHTFDDYSDFEKYSVHNSASKELIFSVECITQPIPKKNPQ